MEIWKKVSLSGLLGSVQHKGQFTHQREKNSWILLWSWKQQYKELDYLQHFEKFQVWNKAYERANTFFFLKVKRGLSGLDALLSVFCWEKQKGQIKGESLGFLFLYRIL